MPDNTGNKAETPAAETQQDVTQASDAKAEAAATASDELSVDDLEAVAGGSNHRGRPNENPGL